MTDRGTGVRGVHMGVQAHAWGCPHVCAHVYVCPCVCVHMGVCACTCMGCPHVCVCTWCACTCMGVSICVCTCVSGHVWSQAHMCACAQLTGPAQRPEESRGHGRSLRWGGLLRGVVPWQAGSR